MSGENSAYPKGQDGQPTTLEKREETLDGRRFSPSTGRNKAAITQAFQELMPEEGTVLEIASGTGEHGVAIIQAVPKLHWIFSDLDVEARASISAWIKHVGKSAFSGPLTIDAMVDDWGAQVEQQHFVGLTCINMIHIAPFAATEGLLAGAGRRLAQAGRLFLYGPFARAGQISDGNARFDQDLKRRDPRWGVRDLDRQLVPLAQAQGLSLIAVRDMPANNLSVVFEKT